MKTICKKALCIALAMALCLGLSCCGNKASAPASSGSAAAAEPAQLVDQAFQALKNGDYEKAKEYIPSLDMEDLAEAGDSGNEFFRGMEEQARKHMSYTIGKVTDKGDGKYTVAVDVSNLDMAAIVEGYYTSLVDALAEDPDADGELSEEQMKELLEKLTADVEAQKKTTSATIDVVVEDGAVLLSDEQLDQMLGGLLTAGEKMDD